MGMIAVGRRRGVRSLAGVLLAGTAAASGCASESDEQVFRGEAPPMPSDVDDAVAEAIALAGDLDAYELTGRFSFGPSDAEFEGSWSEQGVGTVTVVGRRLDADTLVETEVRSDGDTAWVRTDDAAFVTEMPPGVEWLEAPYADLVNAGVLSEATNPWDGLLFVRDLDEVEDGGIGVVNGDLVRIVRGKVHYEAAYNGVTADERARMDGIMNWHDSVRDFAAEIAFDGQGRVRLIDYEVRIGIGGSPSLPATTHIEFPRLDQPVEPPTPPDPDDVVPASEVPKALAALGAEAGAVPPSETTLGETTLGDEGESEGEPAEIDDPAGVLDRDPPEPEPPPADTPADAVETTTLIEGEGPAAAVGDTVYVHYVLVLADGQVPDSSWDTGGGPFSFTIGGGAVIAGWDEGLVGVRAGERRRLVIGADKAYGSQGGGDIPPDAPLAFEVDVVRIDPAG